MGKNFPRPDGSGVVQGDNAPMPNRGTRTGMNGDTYGADLSDSAINRQGGVAGAKSDHYTVDPGCNNKEDC